jgi:hypothetical protein
VIHFSYKNGLKLDVSSPLLFISALEYAIMKVQENWVKAPGTLWIGAGCDPEPVWRIWRSENS